MLTFRNMFNTNSNILFKAIVLALCVISFVHVFLFPLYDINNSSRNFKSYMDFEQSLCLNNIKKRKIWRLSRCPTYGIVTVIQGGRLGNQMWEYASVWAVARRTGLEPYVPRCIKIRLDQVFEQLTVPSFEEISQCPVDISAFVKDLESWTYTNQSIVLPRYSLLPEVILTWVQDIVAEFTLRRKLRVASQQILRIAVKNVTKKGEKPHTFVGVHVRRTDYVEYLSKLGGAGPANATFYENAMRLFEQKYANVIFIVVSDDSTWCAKNFSYKRNVYIASKHKNSPGLDLAILASCNHTIFDYGTFGAWGAILAGGETVYYKVADNYHTTSISHILKNWRTI